jgi:hypothetical protein
MQELKEHPRAAGAIGVGVLLTLVATAVLPPSLWESTLAKAMAEDPGMAGVSGVSGVNLEVMARITWVTTLFGVLFIWPLTIFISSGIYAAIFLFVFGFEGRWRQILALTAHAFLITAAAGLLVAPFRVLAEDPTLVLSVGRLIPGLGDGFLGRFLNLMDLTGLWAAGIVGAGAAIVDGKREVGQGVSIALGASLLLYAVFAWVGGFFSSMTP